METQFNYIIDRAKEYHTYANDEDALLAAVNALPEHQLEEVYNEYGSVDGKFQPVNLLRGQLAYLLINGETISLEIIEQVKDRIRHKDLDYFEAFPEEYLTQLKNYPIGKRDMFANWQRLWGIFHTFFYRDKIKDTTRHYLEQLCQQLKQDLGLSEYNYHWVDFYGASNFGAEWCWIALYPAQKYSHQDAYQFFFSLREQPFAGRKAGHLLRDAEPNLTKNVDSYHEATIYLTELKSEILKLNKESLNYFKLAPGRQASEWEQFRNEGIAALSFSDMGLGDLNQYQTKEELNIAAGLEENSGANRTWNLWLFKTANIGDVIFANKGVNTCIGIGIITSDYYFDEEAEGYQYRRKVNWITDKVYQYKPGSFGNYKSIFRADTFTPTKAWEFLLTEYVRLYPELAPVFDEYHLKYDVDDQASPTLSSITDNDMESDGTEDEGPINYWWLNANPTIWRISNHAEGQTQVYTTHNKKGNKRRIYKYFEQIKPGDRIIGYESSPTKQIQAIYQVTKGIHFNKDNEEQIEFELIEKLEVPVSWNELKHIPLLTRM